MSEPRDARVSRRDVLKLTVGGGAGLAVGGLLDWPAVKAAAGSLKLSEVNEFTTSCNRLAQLSRWPALRAHQSRRLCVDA